MLSIFKRKLFIIFIFGIVLLIFLYITIFLSEDFTKIDQYFELNLANHNVLYTSFYYLNFFFQDVHHHLIKNINFDKFFFFKCKNNFDYYNIIYKFNFLPIEIYYFTEQKNYFLTIMFHEFMISNDFLNNINSDGYCFNFKEKLNIDKKSYIEHKYMFPLYEKINFNFFLTSRSRFYFLDLDNREPYLRDETFRLGRYTVMDRYKDNAAFNNSLFWLTNSYELNYLFDVDRPLDYIASLKVLHGFGSVSPSINFDGGKFLPRYLNSYIDYLLEFNNLNRNGKSVNYYIEKNNLNVVRKVPYTHFFDEKISYYESNLFPDVIAKRMKSNYLAFDRVFDMIVDDFDWIIYGLIWSERAPFFITHELHLLEKYGYMYEFDVLNPNFNLLNYLMYEHTLDCNSTLRVFDQIYSLKIFASSYLNKLYTLPGNMDLMFLYKNDSVFLTEPKLVKNYVQSYDDIIKRNHSLLKSSFLKTYVKY